MAATILLCVAGFVVIYARVDPLTRDFIGAPATATATREAGTSGGSTSGGSSAGGETPQRTPTPRATETPAPTPTEEGFVPTHLSNTASILNFRGGPGTDFAVVRELQAATELRATGETGVGGDGLVWIEFETQDGTVGWIRELDSEPLG